MDERIEREDERAESEVLRNRYREWTLPFEFLSTYNGGGG